MCGHLLVENGTVVKEHGAYNTDNEHQVNPTDPPVDTARHVRRAGCRRKVQVNLAEREFLVCTGMTLAAGFDEMRVVDGGAWI